MSKRIAIIGTGPCGLGQLSAFSAAAAVGHEIPEIVAYERQSDWGGLWNYTWRTGTGAHGEPVHSSMYRYLWSNGPKECLEFADYSFEEHFGKPIPSFPPREVLANYVRTRAEKTGLRKSVRFDTEVRRVSWDSASRTFTVTADHIADGTTSTERFDHVIVATGHFSVPNVPEFEGVNEFPGRVLHAHDFRDAAEFAGQDILIVGASYSAEDIGLQCHKYGARSVTMSYRTAAMGFKWPESMEERPLLLGFDGGTARFSDGTSKDVDALILCTGYLHHFPFLPDELRLKTHNRLNPPGLYKGVAYSRRSRRSSISECKTSTTPSPCSTRRPGTCATSSWNDISLPSPEADGKRYRRLDGSREGQTRGSVPGDRLPGRLHARSPEGCRLPRPSTSISQLQEFKEWEHHKEENILTYRDKCIPLAVHWQHVTASQGTRGCRAMDDSLESYVTLAKRIEWRSSDR